MAGDSPQAPSASLQISVVIPAYNAGQYIERAIRSVLEQSLSPCEVIVVDDGSTDNTGEVIAGAFRDRVKYFRQVNRGVAAARNAGVKQASGAWIAFLDADDYWDPRKLEKQAAAVSRRTDVVLVACGSAIVGREPKPGAASPVLTSALVRKKVRLRTPFPMGVLLRRDVFESLGGFDETLACGEDRELWARIAARHEMTSVPEPLLHVTNPATSLCSNPQLLLRDGFKANRKVMEALGVRPGLGKWMDLLALRRADARVYLGAGYEFLRHQQAREAFEAIRKSLACWPVAHPGTYRLAARLWFRKLAGRL